MSSVTKNNVENYMYFLMRMLLYLATYLFLTALGLFGYARALSSCSEWASHWGGVSCCRLQGLRNKGFSRWDSWALECELQELWAPAWLPLWDSSVSTAFQLDPTVSMPNLGQRTLEQTWSFGVLDSECGIPPTEDGTCVPCIGRWILNHWTTREALKITFLMAQKDEEHPQ